MTSTPPECELTERHEEVYAAHLRPRRAHPLGHLLDGRDDRGGSDAGSPVTDDYGPERFRLAMASSSSTAPVPGYGSRSDCISARRGAPASLSTVLMMAANGTARIAPTTPRSEPAISTATIVVNGDSSTACR